jgi:hypothetical protein
MLVSTTALPPGQGPSMSSVPSSAGRGGVRSTNGKGRVLKSSYGSSSIGKLKPILGARGNFSKRASASRTRRGRRGK